MLKIVVLLHILVETVIIVLFSGLINELKVQKNSSYLKYKSNNIIINVFTVTFEQFNASLLNKSIHLFKKTKTFEQ